MTIGRRADTPGIGADLGGPVPRHEELIVRGPFMGFSDDTDRFFDGGLQVGNVCENYDIIEGVLRTRGGITPILNAETRGTSSGQVTVIDDTFSTDFGAGTTHGPASVTDHSLVSVYSRSDRRLREPWTIFGWGHYGVYYPDATTDYIRFDDPPDVWKKRYKIHRGGAGTASVLFATDANRLTVEEGGTPVDWGSINLSHPGAAAAIFPGSCYFRFTGGADTGWRRIVAIDTTDPGMLTIDVAYGADVVDELWEILIPIFWIDGPDIPPVDETSIGNVGTHATIIPLAYPLQFYICGRAGGTLVDYGPEVRKEVSSVSVAQPLTDAIHYEADDAIIYNNRLVIATSRSWSLGDPVTNRSDPANRTEHEGRIAYSSSSNYLSFDFIADESAGFFDDIGATIGRIRHLFVLRDVLYALSDRGIGAVVKTGNPLFPFRGQVLMNDKKFTFRGKPKIVDGRYAVIGAADGMYKFDGSAITPLGMNVQETYRGLYGLDSTRPLGTANRLYFDDNRDRIFVCNPDSERTLVQYMQTGAWVEYTYNAGRNISGYADWSNVAPDAATGDIRQDVDALLFDDTLANFSDNTAGDKLFQMARNTLVEEGGGTSPATIEETSDFDFGEDRSNKTIRRVRVVYEVVPTNATDVTFEIIPNGNDAGDVGNFTGTLTLSVFGPESGRTRVAEMPIDGITARYFRIRFTADQNHRLKEWAVVAERRLEDRLV